MDNLLFGIEADLRSVYYTTLAMLRHPIIWGFLLGFAFSTLIHMLIMVEQAKHLPHILTKKVDHAYDHLKEHHGLSHSLGEFTRHHKKIRLMASVLVFTGLVVIIVLTLSG